MNKERESSAGSLVALGKDENIKCRPMHDDLLIKNE